MGSGNARRPVSQIAFAAGFNDLSHFSRTYRVRYGYTPRDARSAALATCRQTT
jgi:transcriptional regulator GlxA family with amidase domain